MEQINYILRECRRLAEELHHGGIYKKSSEERSQNAARLAELFRELDWRMKDKKQLPRDWGGK